MDYKKNIKRYLNNRVRVELKLDGVSFSEWAMGYCNDEKDVEIIIKWFNEFLQHKDLTKALSESSSKNIATLIAQKQNKNNKQYLFIVGMFLQETINKRKLNSYLKKIKINYVQYRNRRKRNDQ